MRGPMDILRDLRRAPFLAPGDLCLRSAAIAVFFAIAHALGWREDLSFVCGEFPPGVLARLFHGVAGVAYVAAWFGVVIVVPIQLLAAAFLVAWGRTGGLK